MGCDQKTVERLRRLLGRRRDVVEKKMVGGVSFLVKGKMCCGVTGSALMIRVGPEGRERALARPHARAMEMAGRPLSGFVCVDPPGFRTEAALIRWVQHGLDFVSSSLAVEAPAGKKPRPRR